tara:strand:- start:544 stop:888 length:345 start_codon:yes stop_codon:yes gene_type:complete
MTVRVNKQFENVNDGIQNMIAAATHDYNEFCSNENMQQEFTEGWVVKEGQKYIKISTRNGNSAWGFIVNTNNDKKFQKGDILKCAGYSAPARNKARGNVLSGGFNIQWTGPLYL